MLAAGCAGAGRPAPPPCTLTRAAEVPLSVERGFITAPAVIDDKPVTMVIDTGDEITAITPSAVGLLALQRDPHQRTTLNGAGGTVTTQNVRLQSFGIGGMERLDQSYAVAALPSLSMSGYQAAGVLGVDWLSEFDVDLDLPQRRMTLYRVQGCVGDYLPWHGPRTTLPAFRYGRGLMLLAVTLDGIPLRALLDSGAQRSVVAEAAAARAGADAAALAGDPGGRSVGADGNVQGVHSHRFATLEVGPAQFRGVRLAVSPLHSSIGVDMLLGLDFLRTHEVWIAFQDRRVFVRPAASPAPSGGTGDARLPP
jgi:predicted aspartyl protease